MKTTSLTQFLKPTATRCLFRHSANLQYYAVKMAGGKKVPLNDAKRADAIARVPWVARDAALTSDHYYVAGKARLNDEERTKWLKIAHEEDLSAVELKRSIARGE